MKEIHFSNRNWKSISNAYLNLKTRYRKVTFIHQTIHGLFSGYFIVSSYKKFKPC